MEFTNLDDSLYIRMRKTLRNHTMIGYYNVLRKLNNVEEDGEILARAGTFDNYWEEKEKINKKDNGLCSKIQVYYKDLGRHIYVVKGSLNRSLIHKLKRGNSHLRK